MCTRLNLKRSSPKDKIAAAVRPNLNVMIGDVDKTTSCWTKPWSTLMAWLRKASTSPQKTWPARFMHLCPNMISSGRSVLVSKAMRANCAHHAQSRSNCLGHHAESKDVLFAASIPQALCQDVFLCHVYITPLDTCVVAWNGDLMMLCACCPLEKIAQCDKAHSAELSSVQVTCPKNVFLQTLWCMNHLL